MSYPFVFVHGWGAHPDFWDGLLECLPGIEASAVNLGFVGTDTTETPERAIYVTHSLGTMWALKERSQNIKALIAINGFGCFQNFVDERTLRTMQMRLSRNPLQQMREFWSQCDMPAYEEGDLNIERLQEGLGWLGSWDEKEALSTLDIPILSLAGSDDPLLPMDPMKDHWNGFDMQVCEGAGHALPATNAQWCAKKIQDFVREL